VGPAVRLTITDGIGVIRLSREHGNAINEQLVDDLSAACGEIAADDRIRGVLLAADGRLFCPGLDLQELVELDRAALERFVHDFVRCVAESYALTKPMVAAIHGHAVAGGYVLTLAADWRVLREGARVGLNEVQVGVPLPFGVSMILRESVPRLHLEQVALLGKNYASAEALEAGLVHEVHPGPDFEEHCLERLREFLTRDLTAMTITKRYLRSSVVERIREHDSRLVPEFLDAWFRPETRTRVRAIVDSLRSR